MQRPQRATLAVRWVTFSFWLLFSSSVVEEELEDLETPPPTLSAGRR